MKFPKQSEYDYLSEKREIHMKIDRTGTDRLTMDNLIDMFKAYAVRFEQLKQEGWSFLKADTQADKVIFFFERKINISSFASNSKN